MQHNYNSYCDWFELSWLFVAIILSVFEGLIWDVVVLHRCERRTRITWRDGIHGNAWRPRSSWTEGTEGRYWRDGSTRSWGQGTYWTTRRSWTTRYAAAANFTYLKKSIKNIKLRRNVLYRTWCGKRKGKVNLIHKWRWFDSSGRLLALMSAFSWVA